MRYILTENPYIWARFNTGDTVNITIYDSFDDSIVVSSGVMNELSTTGYFKYLFNPSPASLTYYFYIASTTDEEHAGAFPLGGYPDSILTDTNELQTNQIDWTTASGFATENPPSQSLADYKATGFSVPDEYGATLSGIQVETDKINRILWKAN